ncbi:YodC family protein [Xenorhabdus bovienii]|uniref:YodC family protein n=1 Tax=Xenorhabdus bovienii TaxID=40576 RepID=UPI0023B247AF|nr:DUF2158 domain-containing protein [Xenorhabdus bovienii]MDE9427451.1 YodC family protein [Xenorhabdus bovienii]
MPNPKYKIGDKVKLNSGGPVMSIQLVHKHDRYSEKSGGFAGKYTCQWFAGKKLDNGTFPEASLDPVAD